MQHDYPNGVHSETTNYRRKEERKKGQKEEKSM
jgi:hypothetical protein